jgi:hypothetical protein
MNSKQGMLVVYLLLAFIMSWSVGPVIYAQNAPVTTVATVTNAVPGTISVPVTVINFSNIGAISLSLDYDHSVMHFLSAAPNPLLASMAVGDNDLGTGFHRVIMGWYGSGKTLSNGSAIVTLSFTYIAGNTTLTWFDNGPSCEYADAGANVLNDIPAGSYYINGYVCGIIGSPGPVSGKNTVCQGEQGVTYSIPPLANSSGYTWSVPPGASIISGSNTNSVVVDYSATSSSGNITVNGMNLCGNGPVSSLPGTVNSIPVANAGNDVTIPYGTTTYLNGASGGAGSFGYHWSPESLLVNPDLQNVQTVNLSTTTVFTLVVTNQASSCQNSDQVVVSISGGPLSVNPVAIPGSVCANEPVQLMANAGGGSGTYSCQWTCNPPGNPPWTSGLPNPAITADSSRTYLLMVNDGFNVVNGATFLNVSQLPSATLTGGDTLCGTGSTAILTVDMTGTPPWSLIYSNGIATNTVTGVLSTPYMIETSVAGTYTILSIEDLNCQGMTTGSAVVTTFPVPAAPVITESGIEIVSGSCCGNQWYKEGVQLPGETGQVYIPVSTGHYTDVVTLNGCSSDTSNDIYFVMTGTGQNRPTLFTIEPNPATDHILVRSVHPVSGTCSIEVAAVNGRILRSRDREFFSGTNEIRLDIENLSPGFYFLIITTPNGKTACKLIVRD